MCSTSETDQNILQNDQIMTDQELKEWQQMQINKCRIENIFNKVTEIYRYLEALQAGQDPPEQFDIELEESAISMAIGAYGLAGTRRLRTERIQDFSDIEPYLPNSLVRQTESLEALTSDTFSTLNNPHHDTQEKDENYVLIEHQENGRFSLSRTDTRCGGRIDRSLQDQSTYSNINNTMAVANCNYANNEHQQFVETAVSAAIQRQGLGIMELER